MSEEAGKDLPLVSSVQLGKSFAHRQRATAILLTTHVLSASAFFAAGFLLGRRSRG